MRLERDQRGELEFWPAYVDIIMLVAFVFILLQAFSALRNVDDRLKVELEQRKAGFAKAFQTVFPPDRSQVKLLQGKGEVQVVSFSNSLLFDQGKWELKPAGKTQLLKLAPLLRRYLDPRKGFKEVRICGHTNSDPILVWDPRCPTNWHLSSLRATAVVFLLGRTVASESLSAIGFADNRPRDPMGRPLGKEGQKRIEIELYYPRDWIEEQVTRRDRSGR